MSTGNLMSLACLGMLLALSASAMAGTLPRLPAFRPPAVPLVAHDPYFSVWSMADRLTDDWSRHWTGSVHAMCGLARIDGATYRWAGTAPRGVPVMEQTRVEVLPTRTIYTFEVSGVRLTVTFLTPALPHDIDLLARPLTYVDLDARAIDGRRHEMSVYFDCTGEWVVNEPGQHVTWDRRKTGDLSVLSLGMDEQKLLGRAGDNLRIEWGYLYMATAAGPVRDAIGSADAMRLRFCDTGDLPETDDAARPRAARDEWPALACTLNFGKVGPRSVTRTVMLAYDDVYSVEHMGKRLRPWWRRGGAEAADLLTAAASEHADIAARCVKYDRDLMAALRRVGGEGYARLAALCFRECLAAGKVVASPDGQPLLFSKENFSNGCIGTVDVIYPASPFFLLLSPPLLRAQLTPLLDYASSPRWKWPFAPHDLGTYPLANGQVYGGGERTEENQMPVEESGNMLLMLAALARIEGSPQYADRYWPTLSRWAEYLLDKGMDPENQLCTDDFAGHLAHNANLSLKAILALGAYAQLCTATGRAAEAGRYRKAAEEMAAEWQRKADDGDHYRLAFDREGTWSQKYNLVWDRLLGLGLFPASVARKDMAFYRTRLNAYGLPLDSRKDYTKLDWTVWTATLTGSREDFDAIISPVVRFVNETPDRVPLTDWYDTVTGRKSGFQARSVVGGVYLPVLANPSLWRKWAAAK